MSNKKNLPLKIITLAAGEGLRLKDYPQNKSLPKPLVSILNKSMIEWSLKSYHPFITKGLVSKKDLIFVILEEHDQNYMMSKQIKSIFGNEVVIVKINKITSGPAETAYLAAKTIKEDCSVIFNDCDHFFDSNSLYNKIVEANKVFNCAGIINTATTNSKKPDWSYVELDKNKKIISIKEKDPILAKNGAKGVVASYYFSNIKIFIKEAKLMIVDNDKVGNIKQKEFYISKVYDRLIKKKYQFKLANTNFAYPLGTPEQISIFINKYSPALFYPEAKTIIFDIDGVLFEHDRGFHSSKSNYTYPIKPIKKNIDFLKTEYEKGSCIILMSARVESERSSIILELDRLDLIFHQLILGVTGGTRVLINDNKPNNTFYKTAIAIEVKRNEPINLSEFHNLNETPIKKFDGGSYAETFLMSGEKPFIRKIVSNKIDYERGESVLKGQYEWFKRAKKNKLNVPKIINYYKTQENTILDMEFIDQSNLMSDIFYKEQFNSNDLLKKVLNNLSTFHEINKEKNDKDKSLFNKLVTEKAIPSINTLKVKNIGKKILNQENIIIDGKSYKNIYKQFDFLINSKYNISKLFNENFDLNTKSIIHGDLTLENILVKKNSIYFIDPLGAVMDYKSNSNFLYKTNILFDIGKLCQSILARYESWKNIKDINIFHSKGEFFIEKLISKKDNENFNQLFNFYKHEVMHFDKIVIAHMSIILCRIIRYRVNNFYPSALLCYLIATYWINKLFK